MGKNRILFIILISLMALDFGKISIIFAENTNQFSKLNGYLTDFEFLFNEIKDNYINLKYKESLFEMNWDSLYVHNLPRFTDEMDDAEFYKICAQMISRLRDGHTVFRPNNSMTWSSVFSDYSKIANIFEIRSIQNKNIIIAAPQSYKKYIGFEVVELNDIAFNEIIDSVMTVQYISSNDAGVRYKIFQRKLYFWYFDLFARTVPSDFIFKLMDASGQFVSVSFNRFHTYQDWQLMRKDTINFGLNADDHPLVKIINKNIGYMNIPTFDMDDQMLSSFSQYMDYFESLPIRALIFDIRYNNGGNESYKKILEYGVSQEIDYHKFRYRDTDRFNEFFPGRISNNDRTYKIAPDTPETGYTHWWIGTLYPAGEQFFTTIPVVVLTNESIFSSACDFANVCLNFDLATVIGNMVPLTGFGLAQTVVLPSNNYHICYSFHEDREMDGSYLENQCREPDIYAEQELTDFYNGVDTQLEKAVEFLENESSVKETFKLYSNYPNPFNQTTKISYRVPESGFVVLKIYNMLGQDIVTLVNGYHKSGDYTITFDARNLSSGIYFDKLQAGNSHTETGKMLLIR